MEMEVVLERYDTFFISFPDYTVSITLDKESGTYTAQTLEYPWCITEGDTIQAAYERLVRRLP